ncbi:hypothetical protein JAAARDRAFT_193864 [Jaapia argillacea MUCL 33604]|uniref:Uncharacterized protein n=1 Tax=Jaapia argillacea MUCL 33604 TaxID=933084 RepID=A0A067PS46_9AGAM|nr:hypothetical protein JAAARDRAFT_193864 [Jaapia argillacea MUCL 33604]
MNASLTDHYIKTHGGWHPDLDWVYNALNSPPADTPLDNSQPIPPDDLSDAPSNPLDSPSHSFLTSLATRYSDLEDPPNSGYKSNISMTELEPQSPPPEHTDLPPSPPEDLEQIQALVDRWEAKYAHLLLPVVQCPPYLEGHNIFLPLPLLTYDKPDEEEDRVVYDCESYPDSLPDLNPVSDLEDEDEEELVSANPVLEDNLKFNFTDQHNLQGRITSPSLTRLHVHHICYIDLPPHSQP